MTRTKIPLSASIATNPLGSCGEKGGRSESRLSEPCAEACSLQELSKEDIQISRMEESDRFQLPMNAECRSEAADGGKGG